MGILISCLVIVVILLCAAASIEMWLRSKTSGLSPTVKPAAEAVLRAQLWARISGSYWENEMERQAKFVSTLQERDRLDFFRVIIFSGQLDTSRTTIFFELVGKDAESLKRDLIALKDSVKYQRLSQEQQRELIGCIKELDIIVAQQTTNSTRQP